MGGGQIRALLGRGLGWWFGAGSRLYDERDGGDGGDQDSGERDRRSCADVVDEDGNDREPNGPRGDYDEPLRGVCASQKMPWQGLSDVNVDGDVGQWGADAQ